MNSGNKNEGKTPLDDVSGLIPLHITTRKELHEAEFSNITEATEYYLANPKRLEMTYQGLFNVHKKMFNKVWKWAGKKRKSNKNIGVLSYMIDEEIHKFIGDFHTWQNENIDYLQIATKTHHRLVFIHPFEGGNGRWSRLVANIIFYKNTSKLLRWPDEIQQNKKSSFREQYFKALKDADEGNYKELIKLHKELVA